MMASFAQADKLYFVIVMSHNKPKEIMPGNTKSRSGGPGVVLTAINVAKAYAGRPVLRG